MTCSSITPFASIRPAAQVVVAEATERWLIGAALLVFLLGAAAAVARALGLAVHWV